MKKDTWSNFPRNVQKNKLNWSSQFFRSNCNHTTLKAVQSRGGLVIQPDDTQETYDIAPQLCIRRRSQESRAKLRLVNRRSRSSLRSLSPSHHSPSDQFPLGEVPTPQQAFTNPSDFGKDLEPANYPRKQSNLNKNNPSFANDVALDSEPAFANLVTHEKLAPSHALEISNPPLLVAAHQLQVGGYTINLGSQIGTGGYSSVYEVTDTNKDRKYALKVVNFSKNVLPEIKNNLLEEVRILESLRGVDHVIQLLAYNKPSPDQIYMLLELGQGDLNQILQKCQSSSKSIDTDFVRYWGGQVFRAVAAVHDHNIVHADLKPHNFVIVNGSLKLIDFGIANPMPINATSIHRDNAVGTLSYMAPETLRVSPTDRAYKITKFSDIWSCGVILFEMVYQKHPYDKYYHYNSEHGLLEEVKHPTETPSGSPVPLVLHEVIRDCLLLDPQSRTTARDAADGPFFTPVSVDLKALVSMSKSVYKYCNGTSEITAEESAKLEVMAGTLFQKLIRFNNGKL